MAVKQASADVLFCVGVITVSEVFPRDMQSLAGAVFNTAAQLGTSLGLALTSLLSESVMRAAELHGDQPLWERGMQLLSGLRLAGCCSYVVLL